MSMYSILVALLESLEFSENLKIKLNEHNSKKWVEILHYLGTIKTICLSSD